MLLEVLDVVSGDELHHLLLDSLSMNIKIAEELDTVIFMNLKFTISASAPMDS